MTTAGTRSSSTVAATSTSTASASTSCAGEAPKPGIIALVTPDGTVRQVADEHRVPQRYGRSRPTTRRLIVAESFAGRLTAFDIAAGGGLSNRRVWADGLGPDSICLDAEGAIWTHSADTRPHTGRDDGPAGECVRVREGGEIVQRIRTRPGRLRLHARRTRSARRCSCSPPSGTESRTSTAPSRGAPDRYSPSRHPPPASDGDDSASRNSDSLDGDDERLRTRFYSTVAPGQGSARSPPTKRLLAARFASLFYRTFLTPAGCPTSTRNPPWFTRAFPSSQP